MDRQRISTAFVLAMVLAGAAVAQEKQRIANEGTIGDKWMLADGVQLATAAYPASLAARGDNACIALGYLIGKDGTTSDFAVLKQWNSDAGEDAPVEGYWRSEEHTSELQSLMSISYAVFCLHKKNKTYKS